MSWRELRLEKVVTNKHLRLAMEMEEERRARLENVAATKRLIEMDEDGKSRLEKVVATKQLKFANEKRKARLENMVATTQLRLALDTEEETRAKYGFYMIWI